MPDVMTDTPNKLFLLKKEKWAGIIGTIIGIGAVGMILKLVLPSVIEILKLTLQGFAYGTASMIMGGIALVVGIFLWILIQNTGRIFTIFSKKISKYIIRLGAIEIMEGFAHEYLDGKLEESLDGINGLKKAILTQDDLMSQLREQLQSDQDTCAYLQNQVNDDLTKLSPEELDQYKLSAQGVLDNEKSLATIQASRDTLDQLREALEDLHRTLDYSAKFIRQTVKIKTIEYTAVQAGAKSARAAQRVLVGGKEVRDYNLAAEVVREDISRMMGEIDTALVFTRQFTAGRQVDSAIASDKMRTRIKLLRENAAKFAQGAEARLTAAQTGDITKVTEQATATRTPVVKPSRFTLRDRNQNRQ